jgi:hypothetical protein
MGVHAFRDHRLSEQFGTVDLPLDVREPHAYAVDWRAGSCTFDVDGQRVHEVHQAPDYPMQLMLGVFDFPAKAPADESEVPVPSLTVTHVIGRPLS